MHDKPHPVLNRNLTGSSSLGLRLLDYHSRESDIMHSHDFHELVLVLRGAGLHLTEHGEYPIYPGDVFVIPPRRVHGYRNLKKLRIANFLYYPKQLRREFGELKRLHGSRRLSGESGELLTLNQELFLKAQELTLQMEQERRKAPPGWEFLFRLLFFQLLTLICRASSAHTETPPTEHSIRVCRIIRFCEKNFGRRITLAELAEEGACSIATLTRIFREQMDTSPVAYLNRLRLEHAAELLRTTGWPVSEIAVRCGFPDSNYFTRVFRLSFAQSPRTYRNQNTIRAGT